MTIIKFHTKLIQSILDPVAQQVSRAEGDSVTSSGLGEMVSEREISFGYVARLCHCVSYISVAAL